MGKRPGRLEKNMVDVFWFLRQYHSQNLDYWPKLEDKRKIKSRR